MTNWCEEWRQFFMEVQKPLTSVLNANGCREGWLQGEAYRYFRRKSVAMYTNYLALPRPAGLRNRKADFAIYGSDVDDAPLCFVAELKVYGERGYYQKNLTGGSLGEVCRRLPKDGPLIFADCERDRRCVEGAGLLADYFRLVDFDRRISAARMLILCVQKDNRPDEFGKLLGRIEFEAAVKRIDAEGFWVKCWPIKGSAIDG